MLFLFYFGRYVFVVLFMFLYRLPCLQFRVRFVVVVGVVWLVGLSCRVRGYVVFVACILWMCGAFVSLFLKMLIVQI